MRADAREDADEVAVDDLDVAARRPVARQAVGLAALRDGVEVDRLDRLVAVRVAYAELADAVTGDEKTTLETITFSDPLKLK